MLNRFHFAYNNLGICPLFIWRTTVSPTLTELVRFLIYWITSLISFEKTVVIQAFTSKCLNNPKQRQETIETTETTETTVTTETKHLKRTTETTKTKLSKRNYLNETIVMVSFRSLRWFHFDRFVLVVSLVSLVSAISFRLFSFAVSGFSTCRLFTVVKCNFR